jgi:hypothetical protein
MFTFIKRSLLSSKIRRLSRGQVIQGHPLGKWIHDLLVNQDCDPLAGKEICARIAETENGRVLESVHIVTKTGKRIDCSQQWNQSRALSEKQSEIVALLRPAGRVIVPIFLELIDRGSTYDRVSLLGLLPKFGKDAEAAIPALERMLAAPGGIASVRDAAKKALETIRTEAKEHGEAELA